MPGLLRGVARTAVVAGTATAVSNRVSRRQASRWSQQEAAQQQYAEPPPAAAPPPAAPAMEDEMAEIQQLAQMKEQGILTEEEFTAKKKQILGI
jgi:hypothetical protein